VTVDEFMRKYGPRYYDVPPETLPKWQEMRAALEELVLEAKQEMAGFLAQRVTPSTRR
jgi:hypothetical protein